MAYVTLIDPETLAAHLDDPAWVVVDCRFSLTDPTYGRRAYVQAHIPGAVYAHLEEDFSGPVVPGKTGRHPLPDPKALAATFSRLGIEAHLQVVAYDDAGGAMAAARLWWLLRWLGHDAVAVLDGGWSRWVREGRPVCSGSEVRVPRSFKPQVRSEYVVTSEEVARVRTDPAWRLLDVRAPARFRGEEEPIDPVAGHIPGALNAPFAENLTVDGRFRSPQELRARFEALLGPVPPERVVCYCGSGVTAAHTLLAMSYAGLQGARLYAGSWSEWITDPARPIER